MKSTKIAAALALSLAALSTSYAQTQTQSANNQSRTQQTYSTDKSSYLHPSNLLLLEGSDSTQMLMWFGGLDFFHGKNRLSEQDKKLYNQVSTYLSNLNYDFRSNGSFRTGYSNAAKTAAHPHGADMQSSRLNSIWNKILNQSSKTAQQVAITGKTQQSSAVGVTKSKDQELLETAKDWLNYNRTEYGPITKQSAQQAGHRGLWNVKETYNNFLTDLASMTDPKLIEQYKSIMSEIKKDMDLLESYLTV